MSFIVSPNMSLPVPVVGQEPGPDYAKDVNNSLTLIDAHDHSPGKGVQITPAGMNINSTLTFQGNFATNLAGLTLSAQSVTPALNTIYESGVDLYYVDGNGNAIQITKNGGIAGTSGSISNLTPPASASYISGLSTFVFQSGTGIAANLDIGSITLRNLSPNSTFGLTLAPPSGLSSNYTITLPTLPATPSFLTIDNAGNMTAAPSLSHGITAANIAPGTITATEIAANTIIASNIANGAIGLTQLDPTVLEWNTTSFTTFGAHTFIVPVNVNKLFVVGVGGGGGAGGVATSVGQTGGAGGGSTPIYSWISVSPGDTLNIFIGSGGPGSGPGGSVPGTDGGDTTLIYATGELRFKGGLGGAGNASGVGGSTYFSPVYGPTTQSGGSSGPGGGQAAIPTAYVAIGATGGADLGGNWGGGGGGSGLGPGSPGTAAVGSGPCNNALNATNPGSGGGATGAAAVYSSGGAGGNGATGAVIITWLGHP